MKVTYDVTGELEGVLCVVRDVQAITGMRAESIETDDGRKVLFNSASFRKLVRGDIDTERYIEDNAVSL